MRSTPFIAACALAATMSAATAQDIQPEQAAFRTGFSASKIETFAQVAQRVAAMRKETMTRYFEVEDDAARRALIRQANAELRAIVIEAEGLTLDEFERINAAARTDRALNRHIARSLKALDADG
ncbi:protein of unknown function [Roseivivax lentus]|uniref:DUF4168 domain-containing protein n=1 Tax=Roseivivax lentus TaxID=633194 RepID=A0A1N7L715_9RHOB|nr:DUF4168 domain-containing protein [Roseivivax lentus]SIS69614.1 protein of unknown function [Roseivivax lentus]